MKVILICAAVLLAAIQPVNAQAVKQSETRQQLWLGYFNQTRLTDKSGIWIDLHARFNDDFIKETFQTIARVGYIYYLSDQTRLTAGYAYVTHYAHNGGPDVPEHRPWQQIQWFDKKNGFNLMQWFRVEERYRQKVEEGRLVDSYNFNWRFRYNFSLTFPLKGRQVVPKTPFLFFNDEVHINAGKKIVNNYFDQNRLFVGLGYQFTSHLNAHLGYMYIFQQQPEGNKYFNTHAIRLFVFHNLDLRKKSE